MTEHLLSTKQAARLAHVSLETIKYWAKTNRLPAVQSFSSKGNRWGNRYEARDIYRATPEGRIEALKIDNPNANLLTAKQLMTRYGISRDTAGKLINLFELKKHYFDGTSYVVDTVELDARLAEHPYYKRLLA